MRILIVDDEETERAVLTEILRSEEGVELVEAADGLAGINCMLEGRAVDLCLMDIRMPDVDGLQMLQRIRRDPMLRKIPVIVTSGNRDRNVVLSLAQLGISGYLLKPYEKAKVLAAVQQVAKTIAAAREKEAAAVASTHTVITNTLLLIDDAPELRTILRDAAAREHNWTVVEAENGQVALQMLQDGLRPTLCLCDLRMPVMDGQQFVRAVRENPSFGRLPIMIITGDNNAATVRQFAELRIQGYLVKPFDQEKLRGILANAAAQAASVAANGEH